MPCTVPPASALHDESCVWSLGVVPGRANDAQQTHLTHIHALLLLGQLCLAYSKIIEQVTHCLISHSVLNVAAREEFTILARSQPAHRPRWCKSGQCHAVQPQRSSCADGHVNE